jgi:hypothetical protein
MRSERWWVLSFSFAIGCGTSDDGRSPLGAAGGRENSSGGTSGAAGAKAGANSSGGSSGAAASGGTAGNQPTGGTSGGFLTGGGGGGSNGTGGSSAGTSMGGAAAGGRSSGGGVSGGRGPGATGGRSNGGASTTGGSQSAGTPATGGSGGCQQNIGCKLQAPPSTGDLHQDCVDRINQFRTQCACLPALARRMDGEACADQMAEYDAGKDMAHAGARDAICQPGGAQNECPGYSSNNQVISLCMQQMWDEGPPPMEPCEGACFQTYGHYINMTTTSSTRVACGFYTTPSGKVWSVQNFSR